MGISFLSFVVLGLPGGLLGVAWPSIRASFGLSLDAVGALLLASTAGYLLSSFSSGQLLSSMGVAPFLAASGAVGGLGLLGYALAPAWWAMICCAVLAGVGSGAIDAGLNTYFATNHSASLMNWLHACFGLGATLGPLAMTALLSTGQSWRWGYAIAVLAQALVVLCFVLTLRMWHLSGTQDLPGEGSHAGVIETLRLPTVWLGIVLFFTFTGLEGSGGQWPYTLFTEGRGIDPQTAGFWVSVYWASLTLGRVLFGIVADRIRPSTLIRASMAGALIGSALVWWSLSDLLGFLGLALIGFSLAPVFPVLISETPRRVGARYAPNVIGYQVAVASLGLAILPGLAGTLAASLGLEVIGPFLLVVAAVMFVLHEATLLRSAPSRNRELKRQPRRSPLP